MPPATKRFLGLTPAQFTRRHWQKRPLHVPRALPEYADLVDRAELMRLAERDDVVSRLVMRSRSGWRVEHGPFDRASLRRLPARGWSLLVQNVDQVKPRAAALRAEFAFLPYARLDDVMVSYAPPGGGVGPHFDSYDVFLLQGSGRRRWQVSAQKDLDLVRDQPLRILRRFRPQMEWTVEPGDLLYLPPRCAHDGVAIDECITISIGFRAPAAGEIVGRFLEYLQDRLRPEGLYADPDAGPVRHPGRIGGDMLLAFSRMLQAIRWSGRDVGDFAGRYLTEPKPHVVFERPPRRLTREAFRRRASRAGVRLALKSSMLFHGRAFYLNGEACTVGAGDAKALRALADRRRLAAPLRCSSECMELLHEWHSAGYIVLGDAPLAESR